MGIDDGAFAETAKRDGQIIGAPKQKQARRRSYRQVRSAAAPHTWVPRCSRVQR